MGRRARDERGITSTLVTGDSGGGNLAVALAKAKREGWLDAVCGTGRWSAVPPLAQVPGR